jgi:hypothetical protein
MSMPSIADVQRANDKNLAHCVAGIPISKDDLRIIGRFVNCILSAPGMTAERLAELQRMEIDYQNGCETGCDGSDHCRACYSRNVACDDRGELLAEVLRLRAELEARK